MFVSEAARRTRRRGPRAQRLSSALRRLADQVEDRIRFVELAEFFGDRAFGALLLVFAVPNMIPLPPGGSTILGMPLLLIAGQLALGRECVWLPRAIANRSLARSDLQRLVDYGLPTLRRAERLLAPRLSLLLNDRLIGLACLVLAVILVLPIPFANVAPALGIAAFALGLVQKDGAAVLIGWLATLVSLVIVAMVSGAVLLTFKAAFEAVMPIFGGQR
jgi:hypothetical protein